MANRRSIGMGGGRPFPQRQGFQGSGLSPWQGAPNSMNQGLISNPQQLAMALSSLLQPQQQSPPSLLSLNTSPFSNQNRDFNRFGGNRGRDMRRHEPYNKNQNRNRNFRGGQQQQNRNSRPGDQQKKKEDGKKKDDNKPKKEENEKEEAEKETGDDEDKEGPYKGVPVKYLHCFVCGKEMWDGESMNKHVKGRAHRQMLESLEESMHLTVNILREHMRLSEERKVIELNRMQRVNKKFNRNREGESYCNMCDLKFMGKIVAHRKNEGHQRLKRYLHPKCDVCDKEFPSRMECVEHRLTPDHLRKLHESVQEKEGEDPKAGDDLINACEPDLEPFLEESIQMEAEYPIFELSDDLAGLQNIIPAYKADRPVSTKSLRPFTGFRCEICHRSFEDEDLAQVHLKTRRHYYAFIDAAKHKFKEAQAKKAKEEEEEKKNKAEGTEAPENGDADMYDPEEACNENDENKDTSMEVNDETAEDTTAEQEAVLLGEDDDEVEEVQEEPKVEVKTPATKPAPVAASTPARPTRTVAGGVKNGAGPKSKKARK